MLRHGLPRLLVVDDDDAVRDVCRIGLSRRGFDVDAVGSGEEARRLVRASLTLGQQYHALVVDLTLREVTGEELAAELARLDPRLARRTVEVSGFLDDDGIVDDRPRLRKPFTLDHLTRAIDRVAGVSPRPSGAPRSRRGWRGDATRNGFPRDPADGS